MQYNNCDERFAVACGDFQAHVYDAPDALGGDAPGVVLHLHEDEFAAAAVLFVQVQNGVSRRARSGEGIKNEAVL